MVRMRAGGRAPYRGYIQRDKRADLYVQYFHEKTEDGGKEGDGAISGRKRTAGRLFGQKSELSILKNRREAMVKDVGEQGAKAV